MDVHNPAEVLKEVGTWDHRGDSVRNEFGSIEWDAAISTAEAMQKDAERYRWLREQSNLVAGMRGEGIGMACGNWSKDDQDKRTLDAAIDAAMNGANA